MNDQSRRMVLESESQLLFNTGAIGLMYTTVLAVCFWRVIVENVVAHYFLAGTIGILCSAIYLADTWTEDLLGAST